MCICASNPQIPTTAWQKLPPSTSAPACSRLHPEKHSATQNLPTSSSQSNRSRLDPSRKRPASANQHPDLFFLRPTQTKYSKPILNYPAPRSAPIPRPQAPGLTPRYNSRPPEARPRYSAKSPTCCLPSRPETSQPFSLRAAIPDLFPRRFLCSLCNNSEMYEMVCVVLSVPAFMWAFLESLSQGGFIGR